MASHQTVPILAPPSHLEIHVATLLLASQAQPETTLVAMLAVSQVDSKEEILELALSTDLLPEVALANHLILIQEEMKHLAFIKEIQQLTRRVTILNQFISRSAERCLLFFKVLINIKNFS